MFDWEEAIEIDFQLLILRLGGGFYSLYIALNLCFAYLFVGCLIFVDNFCFVSEYFLFFVSAFHHFSLLGALDFHFMCCIHILS